jgi:hypothetical protein
MALRTYGAASLLLMSVAQAGPTRDPPWIGKLHLDRARTLLSQARSELQPQQWELLDRKLATAERAWERFNALSRSSREATGEQSRVEGGATIGLVSSGAEVGTAVGGASLGALLAVLVALWPAPIANSTLPPVVHAQGEFEAALRDVAEAAKRVKSELEVAAARQPKPPRPNQVTIVDPTWKPDPAPDRSPGSSGDRPPPCELRGAGGTGQSTQPGWLRCTYRCGKYEVTLFDVWGTSSDDCKKWVHLERARKEIESWTNAHGQGR